MTSALPRAVLTVAGACFALVALSVALLDTAPFDTPVRDALLGLASPPVIAAMRVIRVASRWSLPPAILLLLWFFRPARERWYVWIGLMIVALMIEQPLKVLIGRPRPEAPSMGFPSGEATVAAAFFGALFYLAESLPPRTQRLLRTGAIVMIVLVAVARVILRAHWPSDVLGGIALGLALASAAALLARPGRAVQDP